MEWDAVVRETALRSKDDPAHTEKVLNAFFDAVVQGMRTDPVVSLRHDFGYFEMHQMSDERREAGCRTPAKKRRVPIFKKSGRFKTHLRSRETQPL